LLKLPTSFWVNTPRRTVASPSYPILTTHSSEMPKKFSKNPLSDGTLRILRHPL
jgi:hypothetical protein